MMAKTNHANLRFFAAVIAILVALAMSLALYSGSGAKPAVAQDKEASGADFEASLFNTNALVAVTPDEINFGDVSVGVSKEAIVLVSGVTEGQTCVLLVCIPFGGGIGDPPIIEGDDAGHFTIVENHCKDFTLWPGDWCTIKVRFSPNNVQNYDATFIVPHHPNGRTAFFGADNTVPLSGVGKNDRPPPPSNDNFANAQIISGVTTSVPGTTAGATRETGEPDHYTSNPADANQWLGEHSVWYSWTAPASGPAAIDTCTANIDSILAVYTGSQLDALSRVADNNNDACPSGWGSKVTFDAQANTTYRIAVGDAGGLRENSFTLDLAVEDIVAPTIVGVTPAVPNRVARLTNVTATFSEAMDRSTLNDSTFTLVNDKTGKAVDAAVSYDYTTETVALDPFPGDPTKKLAKKTTYTAKISGAKDKAGNTLPDKEWSFKTARK